MPLNEITQLQYPAKSPTENDYAYLCWGTNGEATWTGYRDWVASAWVLNAGEVVVSFLEMGRTAV